MAHTDRPTWGVSAPADRPTWGARVARLAALLLAALLIACGGDEAASDVDTSPAAIAHHECAVCGMVVAEQPAPRGQAVHRDGTHAFACSLGDLRAYLQSPNPRGEPVAVYVESLPAGADPASRVTEAQDWTAASDAFFVPAPDREGIMGEPLLAFADRAAAEAAAAQTGTGVVDWEQLADTPFSELPTAP